MTTRLPFRKATSLATLAAFVAVVCFAEPALAHATKAAPPVSPVPAPQARLQIEHDPLACVTTAVAPLVEAKVVPGPDVARSYVFWRAAGTPYFYYTIMEGSVPEQKGTLPRPLPETKTIDYYVQATDKASLSKKTPDYAPPVVPGNACKVKGLVVGAAGAGLTIGLTDEKQSPIPPGFNKDDIAKVILLSGAVVTAAVASSMSGSSSSTGASAGSGAAGSAGAASAGAAAGAAGTTGTAAGAGAAAGAAGAGTASAAGGISSTALIVGGVVVAGGVGAGIALSNNKSTSTPTNPPPIPTGTPTPTRTPTLTPVPNRFIEVEATWSGEGNVEVHLLSNAQEVGVRFPAGCGSTAGRTERVVLQGTVPAGSYQVTLQGVTCGPETPAQITTILTVATEAGPVPACQGLFKSVPVGGTVDGCTFTIP
jgi:hypothetical protein